MTTMNRGIKPRIRLDRLSTGGPDRRLSLPSGSVVDAVSRVRRVRL